LVHGRLSAYPGPCGSNNGTAAAHCPALSGRRKEQHPTHFCGAGVRPSLEGHFPIKKNKSECGRQSVLTMKRGVASAVRTKEGVEHLCKSLKRAGFKNVPTPEAFRRAARGAPEVVRIPARLRLCATRACHTFAKGQVSHIVQSAEREDMART
jgi:hypothetical protein